MGRRSNYSINKKELDINKILAKATKENLSVKEFALYCKYLAEKHTSLNIKDSYLDEKSIRIQLNKLCESNKFINIADIKDKSGKKFIIKPAVQPILAALIFSNVLDNRKSDSKLSLLAEQIHKTDHIINVLIPKDDLKYIKSAPIYEIRLQEIDLLKYIGFILTYILNTIHNSYPTIRFYILYNFASWLLDISQNINFYSKSSKIDKEFFDKKYTTQTFYTKENCSNNINEDLIDNFYFSTTLKNLLINYFILKVHDIDLSKSSIQIPNPDYESSLKKLIIDHYHLLPEGISNIEDALKDINSKIYNDQKYKKIVDKASEILDIKDPTEKLIFELIKTYAEDTILNKYIPDDSYKFIEKLIILAYSTYKEELDENINLF